jgi:ribosomal protein S18 acetylase RimI-like enzyme
MKRLFTLPAARGLGLGRALVARLLAEAAARGYAEVRLDTLPDMTEAIALYRGLGFVETGPYYPTPVAGTVFFAHTLVP